MQIADLHGPLHEQMPELGRYMISMQLEAIAAVQAQDHTKAVALYTRLVLLEARRTNFTGPFAPKSIFEIRLQEAKDAKRKRSPRTKPTKAAPDRR